MLKIFLLTNKFMFHVTLYFLIVKKSHIVVKISKVSRIWQYRVSGNSSTKKKIKHLCQFLSKSNNSFLNEREMFKVLFWLQVNNMSHSLETKIQVVILIAKYESPDMFTSGLQLFTFQGS